MSQYTDRIQQIKEDWDYLENAEQLVALEASGGKMIYHYHHGGRTVSFLRDIEFEGVEYKKGDTVVFPPTDQFYITLSSRYKKNSLIATLKKWYSKYVRH